MKNKYFNFEKSFISVLSIKCLRYCALSGSFRYLEGENAKQDPLCLTETTVGWPVAEPTLSRSCNNLVAQKEELMQKSRKYCRNSAQQMGFTRSMLIPRTSWWFHRRNEERSKGHTDESSKFQVLRQRRGLAWSRWRLKPEICAKHFSENKTRKTYKT